MTRAGMINKDFVFTHLDMRISVDWVGKSTGGGRNYSLHYRVHMTSGDLRVNLHDSYVLKRYLYDRSGRISQDVKMKKMTYRKKLSRSPSRISLTSV